jgi:zinc protease
VISHHDPSAPVVAVHLMLRAGSRDERPGRTGLAHLLEHLLFEGSLHAGKGEADALLEAAGGSSNGSTWLDRTNYYATVPTHATELALWLERERIAHWLPLLDEAMLETQRGVVINERLQSVENRPYGRADERLHELLFPDGHPYGWPTIGRLDDLRRITADDARAFFERFYTPGNAALVIAGDVVAERAWELAERFFGDLPQAPQPSDATRWHLLPPADGAASGPRDTLPDAVSFPRVYQAFRVPPYGHPDWIALDVLAYVLADGESSRLQRALVRDGLLAQDVDTYLFPTVLEGVWGWVATARSRVEPARMEAAFDQVVAEVVSDGVEEEELAGALRRIRAAQIAELATVEDRAEALAYATLTLGAADALHDLLDRYGEVSTEALRRVAAEQLDPRRAATVTVIPDGEQDDAG